MPLYIEQSRIAPPIFKASAPTFQRGCSSMPQALPALPPPAGVIVMQLHAGKAQQAWQSYQDFLDLEEFSTSGEAYAAENLLEAYCSADPELIQKKSSSGSCWRALDASVRFLPRVLQMYSAVTASMHWVF